MTPAAQSSNVRRMPEGVPSSELALATGAVAWKSAIRSASASISFGRSRPSRANTIRTSCWANRRMQTAYSHGVPCPLTRTAPVAGSCEIGTTPRYSAGARRRLRRHSSSQSICRARSVEKSTKSNLTGLRTLYANSPARKTHDRCVSIICRSAAGCGYAAASSMRLTKASAGCVHGLVAACSAIRGFHLLTLKINIARLTPCALT